MKRQSKRQSFLARKTAAFHGLDGAPTAKELAEWNKAAEEAKILGESDVQLDYTTAPMVALEIRAKKGDEQAAAEIAKRRDTTGI